MPALPAVKQDYGYRRKRPDKVHAEKGCGHWRHCLAGRGIRVCLARRRVESSERLGRVGYVVARSPARLACCRKPTSRYER